MSWRAYAATGSPETYERFVDRLLASPRFGERWAAMWLDLARYADSTGYEKDGGRTIWRYRDWVIEAFNRDLPFDQFTVEQLAGDLLPDSSESQRVATAFHRNTMTNLEGGTDDEEHRLAAVIDRVNTTWEVWQGTTIGCTQCHGHPYDPFRHEEYYSILAFFNNTTDWDQGRWDQSGILLEEPPTLATFSPETETEGESLLGRVRELQEIMEAIASTAAMQVARRDWEAQLDDPEVAGTIGETWKLEVLRIVRTPEADRDDAQRAFIRFAFAEASPDAELNALRERRSVLHEELGALEPLLTPIMQEVPGDRRRTTHVFERGDFLLRTGGVSAGVPASMHSMPDDAPRNRLGLARWLVDPENPLTARVIVNRFWEQLFGIGIVETSEDFGTQGLPPSHPQAAGLAGAAIRPRARVEREIAASSDRDFSDLPAVVGLQRRRTATRPAQPLAWARSEVSAHRRADSRPGSRREWVARRHHVRPERHATAARGPLANPVRRHQLGDRRGPRPLPAGAVYLLATVGPVSLDDYFRQP